MASLIPYNISLTSSSPTFIYQPFRDGYFDLQGDPIGGWRGIWSGNLSFWPAGIGLDNVGTGIPVRQTYMDGATVSLSFEGTALFLCVTATSASYTLTVDNNPTSSTSSPTDPACAGTGAQSLAYAHDLPYGSHSAVLSVEAPNNGDFLFFGGVVTVGLNGTNPTAQHIDDTDPGWNYQIANGSWSYSPPGGGDPAPSYMDTLHWTDFYGPSYTASYTFTGTSAVQLLGLLTINIGPYTITLDNQSYVYNGSNVWREAQQVLFFQGGLDPRKEYTLTLINFDASAPDAQQPVGPDYWPCASIDELILTQTTPEVIPAAASSGESSSAPTSGASPLAAAGQNGTSSGPPVGVIVGGTIGAVAVLSLLGLLAWFLLRRRRATAPITIHENPPDTGLSQSEMLQVQPQPYMYAMSLASQPASPHSGTTGTTGLTSPSSSKTPRAMTQRSPPILPAQTHSTSSGSVPTQSITSPSSQDLNAAPTHQLVSILNQRLRAEYHEENASEPPEYGVES